MDEIICTGLTKNDLTKELKAVEKGDKYVHRCYLCKRLEGVESVAITNDEKKTFHLPKISLFRIERKTEVGIFCYDVCQECRALLELK